MSSKLAKQALSIPFEGVGPRQSFPTHNIVLAQFPGHQRAALHALRQLSFKINLVLELRDSRAPISSINPLLDHVLAGKPKIVLYTKTDISCLKSSVIKAWDPRQEFLRIECGLRKDANRVWKAARDRLIIEEGPAPPLGHNILVTGMPNCGKSTFINTFRKVGLHNNHLKSVARTGNTPGVTRRISEAITLSEEPKIYMYDTPGVFIPQAPDTETMLNMCLTGAVNYRNLVDPTVLADYLLYHINKTYPSGGRYPKTLTNDVNTLLRNLYKKTKAMPEFDATTVATHWVQRYLNGQVAKLVLDDTSIENYQRHLSQIRQMNFDLGEHRPDPRLRKQYMM